MVVDLDFKKEEIDRIIEMAWEDRTPFEAIEYQFGLKENGVRKIMRTNLKRASFERWRKRVSGRRTKESNRNKTMKIMTKKQVHIDTSP